MRVRLIVGAVMMQTVGGDPSGGSILDAAHRDHCEKMLEP